MPSRAEQFATLVAQQPENELFRFSLAQALVAENRFAEAVPHFEFCAQKKADWMMARIGLGKALLQIGRRGDAAQEFELALDLALAQHHEDPAHELRALLSELRSQG